MTPQNTKEEIERFKTINSPVMLIFSLWFYLFGLFSASYNYSIGFTILFIITGIVISIKGIFPIKEVIFLK